MLVVPNAGEVLMLNAATGKTNATAWTLRLFSNNHTPAAASTEADLTEVAGGGYAAIPLTAASWVTTAGTPTSSAYPEQTFAFSGTTTAPGKIYGYYLTDFAGALVYAELLAAPFTPLAAGDTVKITATITLGSVSGD